MPVELYSMVVFATKYFTREDLKEYFKILKIPELYAEEFYSYDDYIYANDMNIDLSGYNFMWYSNTYDDSSDPDLERTDPEDDEIFQYFYQEFGDVGLYDDEPVILMEGKLILIGCYLFGG